VFLAHAALGQHAVDFVTVKNVEAVFLQEGAGFTRRHTGEQGGKSHLLIELASNTRQWESCFA
jgi:hypothetical protein